MEKRGFGCGARGRHLKVAGNGVDWEHEKLSWGMELGYLM